MSSTKTYEGLKKNRSCVAEIHNIVSILMTQSSISAFSLLHSRLVLATILQHPVDSGHGFGPRGRSGSLLVGSVLAFRAISVVEF